jgi:hypothetical protein
VKLSATLLACSLMLALTFWYIYWVSTGETPTPQDTALLVGVSVAIVALTAMLRNRFRRAKGSKQ